MIDKKALTGLIMVCCGVFLFLIDFFGFFHFGSIDRMFGIFIFIFSIIICGLGGELLRGDD